jgi:uncharacterized protein YhbP (UPF0306 family)
MGFPGEADRDRHRAYQDAAARLIRERTSLVLATVHDAAPWCAPVYFVYRAPGFYFFSSHRARHIRHIERWDRCAGAIFEDGGQWRDIHGVQMSGTISRVYGKIEQVKATGHYLAKFPFAAAFLSADRSAAVAKPAAVRLYRFDPIEVFCTSNRLEFGKRVRIDLPGRLDPCRSPS